MKKLKKYDLEFGIFFAFLFFGTFFLLSFHKPFLNWAFLRHQNLLSWYIRPIFLIPLCYFSYLRSFGGISLTFFLLLTSMFWFPIPDQVGPSVKEFLSFELSWLQGEWNFEKILLSFFPPALLFVLSFAFWKKNLWAGLGILVLIPFLKITWSIFYGGASGASILKPAIFGLVVTLAGLILLFFKNKKNSKRESL
ncbi:hypothetical protein JWG44_09710 [Leptospira sp. 201903071]|uniref:hypothetical protein n=1 Tax=Leptospira ainazelensis TaxID=2810034 RepID=UPI00196662FF|nr:hypothetical protein [Leptospira ainazelensis]MBM9500522.1 hypothetical protein [Leptospira ainazelensis]